MIATFKHKGLALFFTKGSYKGVPAQHGSRIERMLDRLDATHEAKDMDLPGFKFHTLKGDRKGELRCQFLGTGELPLSLMVKMQSTLTWRTTTNEVATKPKSQAYTSRRSVA